MKKSFMYFESTEGGMDHWTINSAEELKTIPFWMHDDCKKDDEALRLWAKTAEVGQYRNHRLGVLVRLKDVKGDTQFENDKN